MREARSRETFRSVVILTGIAVLFFLWGLFVFFTVGEKGPPPWDFGVMQDIPGGSSYSTSAPKAFVGPELHLKPEQQVEKQHVAGQEGTETRSP